MKIITLLKQIKISSRLTIIIIAVLLCFSVLTSFTVITVKKLISMSNKTNRTSVNALLSINEISLSLEKVSNNLLCLTDDQNSLTEIENIKSTIDTNISIFSKEIEKFSTIDSEILINNNSILINLVDTANSQYFKYVEKLYEYSKEKKFDDAYNVYNDTIKIKITLDNTLKDLVTAINTYTNTSLQNGNDYSDFVIVSIISIALFFIIGGLLMTIAITISITSSLKELTLASAKIADGNLDVSLSINNRDEIAEVARNYQKVTDTLNGFVKEVDQLVVENKKGNMNYKLNILNYNGVYKNMLTSVSDMIDVFTSDMENVLLILTSFSKGDFDRIIPTLPGQKIIINKTVDLMRNNIKEVTNELKLLAVNVSEGSLSYRIDCKKFEGEWKNILLAVNNILGIVLEPINEASDVLLKFSNGELKTKVIGDYVGDNAVIKNSLNSTTENISSYINEISLNLDRLANKELNIEIEREYLGDFKSIKDSINNISMELKFTLKDISDLTKTVSENAGTMKLSSCNLSDGSNSQKMEVENLNLIINDMIENTKQSSKNSSTAFSLNNVVIEKATQGKDKMNEMLNAIEEIDKSANSISNIIKVITDIAFQTNVLAFNASIEAARSGQSGRGFAIVAEEVRNLAIRSQIAAEETVQLIENTLSRVQEGTTIAAQTSNALSQILDGIDKISKLLDDISEQSKKQEILINNANISRKVISKVTKSNVIESENSLQLSDELLEESTLLKSKVDEFKFQ